MMTSDNDQFSKLRETLRPTGLIPRTAGPANNFTLLNGWICLHGVLD